jgi:hypothetical protein
MNNMNNNIVKLVQHFNPGTESVGGITFSIIAKVVMASRYLSKATLFTDLGRVFIRQLHEGASRVGHEDPGLQINIPRREAGIASNLGR